MNGRYEYTMPMYIAKSVCIITMGSSMMPLFSGAMQTLILLTLSNVFMTAAWYWHLKGGPEVANARPLGWVILISWLLGHLHDHSRELEQSQERTRLVLDTAPEIYSRSGALTKERLDGKVEFRQVSFGYQPGSAVLRGISLTAKPGETIALIGPSGSGKTTLLALLQRFYSLTDGSITVDGVDIKRMTQRSLRSQIGVVFQDFRLIPHLSAFDNVALPLRIAGKSEVEVEGPVREMLAWVGLADRASARPATLTPRPSATGGSPSSRKRRSLSGGRHSSSRPRNQ